MLVVVVLLSNPIQNNHCRKTDSWRLASNEATPHTHTRCYPCFSFLEIILAAIREIDGDIRLGVRDQSNRFSNM